MSLIDPVAINPGYAFATRASQCLDERPDPADGCRRRVRPHLLASGGRRRDRARAARAQEARWWLRLRGVPGVGRRSLLLGRGEMSATPPRRRRTDAAGDE